MKDPHLMSMSLHQGLNRHSPEKHSFILTRIKTGQWEIATTPLYKELINVISHIWRHTADSSEMLKRGPVALKPYTQFQVTKGNWEI